MIQELINELRGFNNCSVDCSHVIVQDLHKYLDKQQERIDIAKSKGIPVEQAYGYNTSLKTLELVMLSIMTGKNMPVNGIGKRPFSIFPI